MSIVRCEFCQKNIDTDFDAEHFIYDTEDCRLEKEYKEEVKEMAQEKLDNYANEKLKLCIGEILSEANKLHELAKEERDRDHMQDGLDYLEKSSGLLLAINIVEKQLNN